MRKVHKSTRKNNKQKNFANIITKEICRLIIEGFLLIKIEYKLEICSYNSY